MPFRFYFLSLVLATFSSCQKDPAPPAASKVPAYLVTTLAGSTAGYADGVGSAAQFSQPCAAALDAQGTLYVADRVTHRIRKITSTGIVTTLAGGGVGGDAGAALIDGAGAEARFYLPQGIAVDAQGNVYVGDTFNHRIRKITPAGVVSTLAGSGPSAIKNGLIGGGYVDGPSSTARFNSPFGVAVDAQGTVYVADYGNGCIRKISPAGVVSTLAGTGQSGYADGPGNTAQFYGPHSIAVDPQGTVYVTDALSARIRKITPAGVVSTLAGTGERGYVDGPGNTAQFDYPCGIAVDARGWVFVADASNARIRRITPAGVVTTLAGTGQYGLVDGHDYDAQFDGPYGLAMNAQGVIYVTDYGDNHIRVLTPQAQ